MKMEHDFVYVSKHSAECKEVHGRVMALIRDVHRELRLKHQVAFQDRKIGSYVRNMITSIKNRKLIIGQSNPRDIICYRKNLTGSTGKN